MLAYLKEKHNVDLRAVDNKNGTALHWAAYLGCEMATSVLLTWLPQAALNHRDKDGFTPLHHGTISGSSRIVRSILLKGADPSIKDDRKRTAMDIAEENTTRSMVELLTEPSIFSKLGCKPPLRPYKNLYIPLICFLVLYIG